MDLTERKEIATKGVGQKKDRLSKWSRSKGKKQTDETEELATLRAIAVDRTMDFSCKERTSGDWQQARTE